MKLTSTSISIVEGAVARLVLFTRLLAENRLLFLLTRERENAYHSKTSENGPSGKWTLGSSYTTSE